MSFTIRKIEEKKPRRALPFKRLLLISLEFARPVLHWYRDWKQRHLKEKKKQKRINTLKRTLIVLVSVLVALLLLTVVAKAFFSVRTLTLSSIASVTGSPLPADADGFTNILLMGQGDANHDGKDLTDTIIVASLDPGDTKSTVLLSFPRDLYLLRTEKMGAGRINTFYRDYKGYLKYSEGFGEEEAAIEALKEIGAEIGRHLELPIHAVVKVDFTAFVQAVDAVEGVDIEVPYDIADEEYPDENFGFEPFIISQGMQHLDGETALKYARSRHTTSDFDRSARQQQLLRALAAKAKAEGLHKNPNKVIEFLKIFRENVQTTLSLREIVGLADLAQKMDTDRVITMQLNDRNALYDGLVEPGGFLYTPPRDLFEGASVLLPVSIPEFPVTWTQIHALKKLLFQTRSVYLADPVISILNGGARSGLARTLATELIRYGFNVDVIENASLDDQETSFVATANEEDYDLGLFFASLFQANTRDLPILPPDEVRQITIVLGEDYQYRPLQALVLSDE